jgi:hypothetical protein
MTNDRPVSLAELPGVWKRMMLVDALGNEDLESQVYWIQSSTLCGDIRKHLRHSTLADLSSNGGAPMIDAFAGELIETDGVFRWEPSLSYRDRNGPPDEGRLSWMGADLHEEGVHSAYRERWVRIAAASEHDFALALRHPHDDRQGWVLKVGSFLFFARQAAGLPSTAPAENAEFSLFEALPEGPRLVLSTVEADGATCPLVEFADDTRRTIRLSEQAGGVSEIWHIAAIEGAAHAIGSGVAPPLNLGPTR